MADHPRRHRGQGDQQPGKQIGVSQGEEAGHPERDHRRRRSFRTSKPGRSPRSGHRPEEIPRALGKRREGAAFDPRDEQHAPEGDEREDHGRDRGHRHRMGGHDRGHPAGQGRGLQLLSLLDPGRPPTQKERRRLLGRSGEPGRGRRQEPTHLAIGDPAHRLGPDPPPEGARKVGEVPSPRGHHLPGLIETPRHQVQKQPADALDGVERKNPEERDQSAIGQQGGQRGPFDAVPTAEGSGPRPNPRPAAMMSDGTGGDHHPEPGQPHPPAVVEVSIVRSQALVGEACPGPCRPGEEHGRRGHEQNLPRCVVLTLVELPLLERRLRVPEPVSAEPDLAEHSGPVPVKDLRADESDVLDPTSRSDHSLHRMRFQGHVVVKKEHEVGLARGRQFEGPADRPGDTVVAIQPKDAAAPKHPLQHVGRSIGRGVVDGQDPDAGVGLAGQRGEDAAEPWGAVPRHENGEDAGMVVGLLHAAGDVA